MFQLENLKVCENSKTPTRGLCYLHLQFVFLQFHGTGGRPTIVDLGGVAVFIPEKVGVIFQPGIVDFRILGKSHFRQHLTIAIGNSHHTSTIPIPLYVHCSYSFLRSLPFWKDFLYLTQELYQIELTLSSDFESFFQNDSPIDKIKRM